MSNPQDDFDKLRKLLALKNGEQPPPGYFERLPGKVTQRIEAQTRNQSGGLSFMQRMLSDFDLRPLMAFSYVVVMGGLLACVQFFIGGDEDATQFSGSSDGMPLVNSLIFPTRAISANSSISAFAPGTGISGILPATNSTPDFLFNANGILGGLAQPVGFETSE